MTGIPSRARLMLLLAYSVTFMACLHPACAAEITGTVSVDYKGLFEAGNQGYAHPISIALLSDDEQKVQLRESKVERIEIVGNRMAPSFLTVQTGDKIEFINRDSVFHQLFSLSHEQPLTLQLDRSGTPGKDRIAITLAEPGTTHIFCRIHNKSYARIDVVKSPYLQTIQPGQTFHFVGITPGKWKLRLASPAAETQIVEVSALTAPPPLHFTLASHNGGASSERMRSQSRVEQLYIANDR